MSTITIREATPDDIAAIARVNVDSWLTTYRGIVPDAYLAGQTYERAATRWQQIFDGRGERSFTYVAQDGRGRVVGYANGGAERTGDPVYRGELYAIYILAAHQRAGTGRRLVQAFVRRLSEMNYDSMLVWVMTANPATRFYESLGGKQVYEREDERGGVMIKDVAYGWKELRSLLEGTAAS